MGMVWQFGILASVLVLQFAPTEGHGRLIHPQSRNLNDNGAVAGGPGAVHNYGAGEQTMYKHGVCGNAADVPQSYNKVGPIQATYESGSVAEFKVAITAHHVGYFEFELCLDAGRLSEDCFMKHRLLKEGCDDCQCEGDSTHSCADCDTCRRWWKPLLKAEMGSVVANNYTGPVLPGQGTLAPYEFVMRYAIPAGIKSRNAVLRWHYMTTNSCTSKSSAPEEFWNCADVAIKDVHGNVGGQVDFNNTHLQSMVVDNLVSDMKNGNLKGVYSTCPRNEFGLVGVAPGGEYTCGEKSGESWEDCKHLLSVPGSLADCSAPEVPLIICESQCSSTWFQCSAGVAYKQTVPDGTKCKDNYFVLAAKCTSDSDWKIPTETPQPIDSDTVSSKRCVVGENPNKQNVDDKDCAACAEGRTWWPCNVPKLCTCRSSSGVVQVKRAR